MFLLMDMIQAEINDTDAVLWISSSSAELFLSEKKLFIKREAEKKKSGIKVWVI